MSVQDNIVHLALYQSKNPSKTARISGNSSYNVVSFVERTRVMHERKKKNEKHGEETKHDILKDIMRLIGDNDLDEKELNQVRNLLLRLTAKKPNIPKL